MGEGLISTIHMKSVKTDQTLHGNDGRPMLKQTFEKLRHRSKQDTTNQKRDEEAQKRKRTPEEKGMRVRKREGVIAGEREGDCVGEKKNSEEIRSDGRVSGVQS